MRATDEVETGVLHHFHVTEEAAVRHRVAPTSMILVCVHTPEVVVLAVEKESLVRRPLEPAETKRRRKLVGQLFAVVYFARRLIKEGMLGMPQLWFGDGVAGLIESHGGSGGNRLGGGNAGNRLSLGIDNNSLEHTGFRGRALIANFGLHIHRAGLPGNLRRADKRAIPSDVQRAGRDQSHVAINAAAENVFTRARGELRIPTIVEAHSHQVVAGLGRASDVEREPSVAALVFAQAPAVDKDLRVLKRALKFKEQLFAGPFCRQVKVLAIPAVSDVELR